MNGVGACLGTGRRLLDPFTSLDALHSVTVRYIRQFQPQGFACLRISVWSESSDSRMAISSRPVLLDAVPNHVHLHLQPP